MIADSRLEGAGRGLFFTKSFKEGDLICTYEGKELTGAESLAGDSMYSWSSSDEKVIIDGSALDSYGPFINDPLDEALENVYFVLSGKKVDVHASCDVVANQEALWGYGWPYWEFHSKHLPAWLAKKAQEAYGPARRRRL